MVNLSSPSRVRRILGAAQQAAGVAVVAQATADTALTSAGTAQGTADSAASSASIAGINASSALTTATNAVNLAVRSFEGATLVNGTLSAVASAGALTISILTASGTTPSALDAIPVQVTFRDNTTTEYTIHVTSAKTLTIPNGGYVGVNTTGYAFRIWVMGILNNAHTDFELAVCNRVATTGSIIGEHISALPDRYIYGNMLGIGDISLSTSNNPGAGIIFTQSIATVGRAVRLLGQLLFESGLATPTVWVAPSRIVLQGRGVPGPGEIVNDHVWTDGRKQTFAFAGAGILPLDDTQPLYAERGFWTTLGWTPQSCANFVDIQVNAYLAPPAGGAAGDVIGMAVGISNSDTNLIGVTTVTSLNKPYLVHMRSMMRPFVGGFNQTNFEFGPVWSGAAGNVVMNGVAASRWFAGTLQSTISIREIIV